jgi:two-component system, NarL family, response regulator DegU
MKDINVGIADDHSLFREGISMIISRMSGITLCLEAISCEDLMAQMEKTPLDVVLLDIEMKHINGIETLKKLVTLKIRPKVIMLSMHTEPRIISYMMELGANGYLQKDIKRDELELAIRTVYEKGVYFNEPVANSLLTQVKNKGRKPTLSVELSAREKEVLALICQEHTTQEIGEKLFISERTVEGHRKNLCSKLGVKNTAGLVKKAIQLNLIDIT